MMHLLMQASSVIVARPGTGTTSEAIISGCPIIFNNLGGFMPQEWITLRYAHRHGFDTRAYRPADLPGILRRWHEAPETYAAIRQNLLDSRPAGMPRDVLRMVRNLGATLPVAPSDARRQASSSTLSS